MRCGYPCPLYSQTGHQDAVSYLPVLQSLINANWCYGRHGARFELSHSPDPPRVCSQRCQGQDRGQIAEELEEGGHGREGNASELKLCVTRGSKGLEI